MKNIVLLIGFILTLQMSFAANIDSLFQLMQTSKGIDKADVLLTLSLKLRKEHKDSALTFVREASKIADEENNIAYQTKSIIVEGRIYLANNEKQKAEKLFFKAEKLAVKNNYDEGLIKVYYCLLNLYKKMGKYSEAIKYGKKAIEYSNKIGDIKKLSTTLLTMGTTYYFMGDFDNSITSFEESLTLKIKLDDKIGAAGLSMNIGVISFSAGKFDESLKYYHQALEVFEQLNDTVNMGLSMENIALTLQSQGKLDSALTNFKKALTYYTLLNSQKRQVGCLENLAIIYSKKGEYKKALDYQLKSIKIQEKEDNKRELGYGYINLGNFYNDLKQYDKYLAYVKKSLALFEEIGDQYNIARVYSIYSTIYNNKEDFEKAVKYAEKSIKIRKEIGDERGLGGNYLTLGNTYKKTGDYNHALEYYLKSLKIREKIGETEKIAGLFNNIGVIYFEKKNYKKANEYYAKALAIREKLGIKEDLNETYKTLSTINYELKQYKSAYDYLLLYSEGSEEFLNNSITQQIIDMQVKYESEKKEQEIALLQKEGELEKIKHEEETRRNNLIIYSSVGFLILIAFIAIVLFRQNVQKKKTNLLLSQQNDEITKQKEDLEFQKHIVDEKNREITDSITYAKRIQEAILPPQKLVKEWLPNSFVLYKPKDIVAGDFYWMENVGDSIIFAVADCTGHGVPGAMVSVVCHNAMNSAVREFKLTEPAKILDKTRELVIETFEKSDEEVKDGMDIALCSFDTNTKQLNYSGANNALYLIRGGELIDYKADKQPIGQYINQKPFTNHVIELQKGDAIYIFSDGYVDQFGGEKGKKLKSKSFKKLILSFQGKSMEEQRSILDKAFEDWKGALDQIDDVCVIGVKI